MSDLTVMGLSRTGEWQSTRTGRYETVGLNTVDNALASRISAMFTNAVVLGNAPGTERFASFLKWQPQDRVFAGKFDDVAQILRSIAQEKAGQQPTLTDEKINSLALPVVNVSRTFDLVYENGDEGKSVWNYKFFTDDSGKPLADLLTQYVSLSYEVMLIAAEKETLAMMCNALAASFYSMTEHTLSHTANLFNSDIPLQSAIATPKSLMFTEMTPSTTGRIFAASLPLTVTAQLVSAWEVEATRMITNVDMALRG
ncbi:hypothetical protein [Rosenbergiella epipactidis]|uniref:hypothetical protein n=1 Tax=Rosenbergiella epipactidis TaxID=1544694 RepID=UPI001F4DD871|nr:hypothetical protein [Rosenbergiella epipactidis]